MTSKMLEPWRWLRGTRPWHLAVWALGPKYVFGEWLLGVAVACALSYIRDDPADRAALAGWALQTGGLVTALLGLWKLPALLGKDGFGKELKDWAHHLPEILRRRASRTVSAEGVAVATVVMTGKGEVSLAPSSSVEERIARLERWKDAFSITYRADLTKTQGRIDEVEKTSQRATAELDKKIRALDDREVKVAVGGFHPQLVGLFWFFLGTLWGTLPKVSSHLFGFVFGW